MNAAALLADLRAQGVALRAVGDRLQCKPAGALTPELRARIAAHKPALVALLTAPDTAPGRRCIGCGAALVAAGGRWVCPHRCPWGADAPTPARPCYLCGCRAWRRLPDGRVLCGVCSPPARRPQFSLDGLFPRKGR